MPHNPRRVITTVDSVGLEAAGDDVVRKLWTSRTLCWIYSTFYIDYSYDSVQDLTCSRDELVFVLRFLSLAQYPPPTTTTIYIHL